MMLYYLDRSDESPIHWTEIYVIITVSTMLCEEIREVKLIIFILKKYFYYLIKLYYEYKTRMLERWSSTGSTVLTVSRDIFYCFPYFLFYLGLILRYIPYNDTILTTIRFVKYFKYFLINNFIVELFGRLILSYGILNHLNSL